MSRPHFGPFPCVGSFDPGVAFQIRGPENPLPRYLEGALENFVLLHFYLLFPRYSLHRMYMYARAILSGSLSGQVMYYHSVIRTLLCAAEGDHNLAGDYPGLAPGSPSEGT